jgi:type I restriction enzyme S subunit
MKCKLGDICLKIGSGATPRGGKEAYCTEGISLIRSQNVLDFSFSMGGLAYINDTQARQLDGVTVNSNDVLLNITGDSVARACIVPTNILPARVNQHVAIIRPDDKKADGKYILYFLQSIKPLLLQISSSGGTRNALTKSMIEALEINLPSISEQKAIADTLSCLDDKIELNNRMNRTLEEIAQAIFKSWFVDFEPFQDGEFVDSELGSIPKGWRVGTLTEIADYLNGLAMQKYPPESEAEALPVLKIKELRQGRTDAESDLCSPDIEKKYVIHDGDVVFSWSGSLLVNLWCGGTCGLNQHLFKVTSSKYQKWFYYMWTLYHLREFQAVAKDKATTMGHIKRENLTKSKVLIPSSQVLEDMNSTMSPIIEKIIANRLQSRKLEEIRDSLLPKLMSGEIRVPMEAK